MRCTILLSCLLACSTGCARYEFDLVEPPDLAQHVGRKQETSARLGDLDYRMISYDNRLIIRILNPTDSPLELLGDESFVVDPDGESHPLRGVTIAPDSFAKVILPPLRDYVYDPGPRFGIGFGIGISSATGRRGGLSTGVGATLHDHPRYLAIPDDSRHHWEWTGQSSIRLRLAYRSRDDQRTFHHDFTFRRVKV